MNIDLLHTKMGKLQRNMERATDKDNVAVVEKIKQEMTDLTKLTGFKTAECDEYIAAMKVLKKTEAAKNSARYHAKK